MNTYIIVERTIITSTYKIQANSESEAQGLFEGGQAEKIKEEYGGGGYQISLLMDTIG